MVWATAQMVFPEDELFAAMGTAWLLAPGHSTPPPAHTTAPSTHQPHGAHHHMGLAVAPRTLRGRAASVTSHSLQAVLIAQSRGCIHETHLLPPSHLCSHTRRCSWNPPDVVQSKTPSDLHWFLLPFLETQHLFHHIPSSCNRHSLGVWLPLPQPPVSLRCRLFSACPLQFSALVPH